MNFIGFSCIISIWFPLSFILMIFEFHQFSKIHREKKFEIKFSFSSHPHREEKKLNQKKKSFTHWVPIRSNRKIKLLIRIVICECTSKILVRPKPNRNTHSILPHFCYMMKKNKTISKNENLKLRAAEPEPPKQEEEEQQAVTDEVVPPNAFAKNNAAASTIKKDPTPPAPYRYCMPTHAVYTPPKPTARKLLRLTFILLSISTFLFNGSHVLPTFLFITYFSQLHQFTHSLTTEARRVGVSKVQSDVEATGKTSRSIVKKGKAEEIFTLSRLFSLAPAASFESSS